MKIIQRIFGYLLCWSLLSLFFSNRASLAILIVVSVFIKIDYHPQAHRNPFAFAVHPRNLHLGHRQ